MKPWYHSLVILAFKLSFWGSDVGIKEQTWGQQACALNFLLEGLIVATRDGRVFLPLCLSFPAPLSLSLHLQGFIFGLLHCWHMIHIYTLSLSNSGTMTDLKGARERTAERDICNACGPTRLNLLQSSHSLSNITVPSLRGGIGEEVGGLIPSGGPTLTNTGTGPL